MEHRDNQEDLNKLLAKFKKCVNLNMRIACPLAIILCHHPFPLFSGLDVCFAIALHSEHRFFCRFLLLSHGQTEPICPFQLFFCISSMSSARLSTPFISRKDEYSIFRSEPQFATNFNKIRQKLKSDLYFSKQELLV